MVALTTVLAETMTEDAITWAQFPCTQIADSVRIPELDEGPMRGSVLAPVLRDRCVFSGTVDLLRNPSLHQRLQPRCLRNHEVDIVDLQRLASTSWCGCMPNGWLRRLTAALYWVVAIVSGNARPVGDDFTLKRRSGVARNGENASWLLLGATVVESWMFQRVTDWMASLSTAFTQELTDAPVSVSPPAGVGVVTGPQKFLKVGDVVRARIDGLGVFENRLGGRAV
jgi:hypothetical protein